MSNSAVEAFLRNGGKIEVVPTKSTRQHKKAFKTSDYSKSYDRQVTSSYAYSDHMDNRV